MSVTPARQPPWQLGGTRDSFFWVEIQQPPLKCGHVGLQAGHVPHLSARSERPKTWGTSRNRGHVGLQAGHVPKLGARCERPKTWGTFGKCGHVGLQAGHVPALGPKSHWCRQCSRCGCKLQGVCWCLDVSALAFSCTPDLATPRCVEDSTAEPASIHRQPTGAWLASSGGSRSCQRLHHRKCSTVRSDDPQEATAAVRPGTHRRVAQQSRYRN